LPGLPSDVPQEVKDAMEAFRKAAEADVKPSFEVSPKSSSRVLLCCTLCGLGREIDSDAW
jgi:hypothetical protein